MTIGAQNPQDVLAQRLRDLLTSHQSVREVRMFGGLSFMVDDRIVVAARQDGDLLVRTDPATYDELLRRGAEPARIGEHRRMGRGWLTVPYPRIQDDADLVYWVNVGIDSRKKPT
ncbi:MAG: TfoX/Sxy family protein [Candidatus Nanopelagicales bacterium]